MRVATWNVWWRHGDWERRRVAVLAALREIDADVVGLQEVSTRDPDQVAWLRGELGHEVVAGPDDGGFSVANAIVSRWPILDHGWRYLDVGERPPHRTVVWATVDAPAGPVPVYCTHLSHGFAESALRQRQLRQVVELMVAGGVDGGHPPILLGDLNAVPESDEIRMVTGLAPPPVEGTVLSDAWAHAGEGPGITYSAANPHVRDSAWPERRLDYVLVAWPRPRPLGNPRRARLFGTEPHRGVVPSDHYGVVVDLDGEAGA